MSLKTIKKSSFISIALGRPWCEAIAIGDGRQLLLRPIQPSDASILRQSFKNLSPHDVRMRFMHPLKELSPEYAQKLVEINPDRAFALVLVEAKAPGQALIGAVARTAVDEDGREAEFAIVLGEEIRGLGLGRYLMEKLIEWCRQRKLDAIYGFILEENTAMLGLAHTLGFALGDSDEGVVLARLALRV
ncbi:MAG: GNAT family N-acetyltransferase [Wenzhouxiangella sp.]